MVEVGEADGDFLRVVSVHRPPKTTEVVGVKGGLGALEVRVEGLTLAYVWAYGESGGAHRLDRRVEAYVEFVMAARTAERSLKMSAVWLMSRQSLRALSLSTAV